MNTVQLWVIIACVFVLYATIELINKLKKRSRYGKALNDGLLTCLTPYLEDSKQLINRAAHVFL